MQAQNRFANQVLRGLLAAAVALIPMTSAASQQLDARFVDRPAERRILVSLGAVDSVARTASDTIAVLSVAGLLSHEATLHRFRVELLDSARRPVSGMASWDVTLYASAPMSGGQRGMQPMVRLSAEAPDVRVPRPYGVHLDAGDSLRIVASLLTPDSTPPVMLQITIEYESPDQPASRLPALSLSASEMTAVSADSERTVTDRSWTWQTVVGGRIVAIAGRHLIGAEALILEDAATGEVLWSTRAQNPFRGAGSAQQGEIIRPSVVVQPERSYRLRAIFSSAAASAAGPDSGTPLAMLFPGRPAAR